MTFDYRKLRGRIYEYYGTQEAFADEIGISANYLSMCLKNKRRFSTKSIDRMVNVLEIPASEVGTYFFKTEVR